MESVTVRFENPRKTWWVLGRNGIAQCTGIDVWQPDVREGREEVLFIDFLNSKGDTVRGGAMVPPEAFEELAIKFLTNRGFSLSHGIDSEAT